LTLNILFYYILDIIIFRALNAVLCVNKLGPQGNLEICEVVPRATKSLTTGMMGHAYNPSVEEVKV
jgi:hypothetical protein